MFPDRMDAPRFFPNRYFGPAAGGGGGGPPAYTGSHIGRRRRWRRGYIVILFALPGI